MTIATLTRRFAAAGTSAAILTTALLASPAPAATASSFTVTLQPAADKVVAVDNLSSYSNGAVAQLVQWADRGMASKDPAGTPAASGQMNTGDQVVVTNAGIYWLDVVDRGGLLSGAWPISAPSGQPQFAYRPIAAAPSWSPNAYLPASNAKLDRPYDGGQTINVLPTGGADGSCEPGKGTWMIGNTANCGTHQPGVAVALRKAVSGSAHSYSVSGTMYQAGLANTTMVDAAGRAAEIRFSLTYTFRDRTNNVVDYNKHAGTQQRRVRTEVELTPTADIDLGTLVVAGNGDLVSDSGRGYPVRKVNLSNTARNHWEPAECGPGGVTAAGSADVLCDRPDQVNWFQQNNLLPNTLRAGDWVTHRQNVSTKSGTDRAMTLLVPNVAGARLPERIDHIWNGGLGVTALDVDYFNGEQVFAAANRPIRLAFDTQLETVVR